MAHRKDGKIWVEGLETQFTGQSLSSLALIDSESHHPTVSVLPDLHVVKIGGQSVMDRGASAVKPILAELVAARKAGLQLLIGTGGGTRARHAYAIGLDLGMPTAMLARIGGSVPVQNARMLQMLTAKDGGIMCYADDFEKLPLYLQLGVLPIMSGMPPFEFWEKAPKVGRIPQNRTDAGVYLIAEFFAARRVIYIKDEEGLFTDDPKKNPDATFIPEITAKELLDSGQDDLVVERCVLEYMERAQSVKEIRIINGLVPGNVTKALAGEPIGTVIRSSKA